MKLHFDIDIEIEKLRQLMLRGRKAKPEQQAALDTLVSETSIACAIEASMETGLPHIIAMATKQLTELIEEITDSDREGLN
jgi:hypothetical protein